MAGAKIVVLYPPPTDPDAFERAYTDEHIPMAKEKIGGATKFVLTTVRGAVNGDAPFYRVAEIHFPSMEALQESAATDSTQECARHATALSTGGVPIFLIADEETMVIR